jgi:hypothetical protein
MIGPSPRSGQEGSTLAPPGRFSPRRRARGRTTKTDPPLTIPYLLGEGDLPLSGPESGLRLGIGPRITGSLTAVLMRWPPAWGRASTSINSRLSPLELCLDPGDQGRKDPGPVFRMILAREEMGQFMT